MQLYCDVEIDMDAIDAKMAKVIRLYNELQAATFEVNMVLGHGMKLTAKEDPALTAQG